MSRTSKILVTGATGYIGARLVPRLLSAGYHVRAVARSLQKLQGCNWPDQPKLELMAADALDQEALRTVSQGCSVGYYLVHSMNPQHKDFAEADRLAANNMVSAAAAAGLERIIYLGALGERTTDLSHHLRSRAEVSEILQSGPVPVTVLRAAMIIGSGSASFEILRYLVDRLPFMITPRWVRTPCQPIAVRNVLEYLIGCLKQKQTIGQVFDIGGPEVLTYQQLMDTYAEEAGLRKRLVVPVPFFTPKLSSYWIHLVTPVPSYIGRPLAQGLRNPVVCVDSRIRMLLPQNLLDCRTAIKLAIARLQHQQVESHWTDAGLVPPAEWSSSVDPKWVGGSVYEDLRSVIIAAVPNEVWERLSRLGGATGWYYGNWLRKLRGIMDRLLGGVGLARGRWHVSNLKIGDALDFWRVAAVEKNQRLLLVAEMKLPGKAILEFTIEPFGRDKVRLQQTAKFPPAGLSGMLYWLLVTPMHNFVFNGMLRGIVNGCGRPTPEQPVIKRESPPVMREKLACKPATSKANSCHSEEGSPS